MSSFTEHVLAPVVVDVVHRVASFGGDATCAPPAALRPLVVHTPRNDLQFGIKRSKLGEETTLTALDDGPMEARLVLAEVYLVPAADGGLTMRSPRRSAVLRGKLVTEIFPSLLPLLDGTRTRTEILAKLGTLADTAALDRAIERLLDLGMIQSVEPEATAQWPEHLRERLASQNRFLAQYGGDTSTTATIARSRVLLAGEGPLMPSIALGLSSSGVATIGVAARRVITAGDVQQSPHLRQDDIGATMGEAVRRLIEKGDMGTNVQLVPAFPATMLDWQQLAGDYDVAAIALDAPVVSVPWIGEFNKAALAAALPWTSGALLQRASVHIGPSVIPGQTACWKCFEYRLKSNLDAVVRYEEFQVYVAEMNEYLDQGNIPAFTSFTGSLVALETIRLAASDRINVQTAGSLLTIDLWEYRMENHPVLKLPRCPHCSPTHLIPQERTWS